MLFKLLHPALQKVGKQDHVAISLFCRHFTQLLILRKSSR